jgi:putative intracellular protease/amidase
MRILMLLTAGRGDRPTRSFGLDEVVEPYYSLQDAGAEVVVCSNLGGDPPIRVARQRSARANAALQRFRGDRRARDAISDTLMFAQVFPEDFDGGLWIGALEKPAATDASAAALALVTALLAAGKPTAVVPGDLLAAHRPLAGPLIIGRQVRSSLVAAKALLAALKPCDG